MAKITKINWNKDNLDPAAIIALDAGNNFLKVYALLVEGRKAVYKEFSIPHGFIELTPTEWQEATIGAQMSRNRQRETHLFQMKVGGTKDEPELKAFKIGRGAYNSINNAPLLGSNKYKRGGIDALMLACLLELFPNGHNNLTVSYGFPPTEWQQTNLISELLSGRHTLKLPSGKKIKFHARLISGWDENVGGLINAISMNERSRGTGGKFSTGYTHFNPSERIIVMDLGGWLGSICYANIDESGFPVLDYDGQMASIDGGGISLRDDLRKALKLDFSELKGMRDSDFSDDDMDRVLQTGEISISNVKYPAKTTIAKAMSYLNLIKEPYGNRFAGGRTSNGILLTGGTVPSILPYLRPVLGHDNIILAGDEATMYLANVRGGMVITIDQMIVEGTLPDIYATVKSNGSYHDS